MTADRGKGLLIVVSAPSGAGKGTILKRVMEEDVNLRHTVSATTRPPREGEVDGVHYHFIDHPTFERWIGEGRFVEWAKVHTELYGTLHSELDRIRAAGKDVVLELDVQGMRSIRKQYPEAVTVFIEPPSIEALEARIRARGGMPHETMLIRLENAKAEMAAKNEYDCRILNDHLDEAVRDFQSFVARARHSA